MTSGQRLLVALCCNMPASSRSGYLGQIALGFSLIASLRGLISATAAEAEVVME